MRRRTLLLKSSRKVSESKCLMLSPHRCDNLRDLVGDQQLDTLYLMLAARARSRCPRRRTGTSASQRVVRIGAAQLLHLRWLRLHNVVAVPRG